MPSSARLVAVLAAFTNAVVAALQAHTEAFTILFQTFRTLAPTSAYRLDGPFRRRHSLIVDSQVGALERLHRKHIASGQSKIEAAEKCTVWLPKKCGAEWGHDVCEGEGRHAVVNGKVERTRYRLHAVNGKVVGTRYPRTSLLLSLIARTAIMRSSSCKPSLRQSLHTQSRVHRVSDLKHAQYCLRHFVRPHRQPLSRSPPRLNGASGEKRCIALRTAALRGGVIDSHLQLRFEWSACNDLRDHFAFFARVCSRG